MYTENKKEYENKLSLPAERDSIKKIIRVRKENKTKENLENRREIRK